MARRNAALKIALFFFLFCFFPKTSDAYSQIISLKPNITEILFALGAGSQVVGVTTFCDRPAEAQKIPRVADYITVHPEKVLKLQPDLMLGSTENSSQKEVYFLMDRGIKTELLPFSTLEETMASIRRIGDLLGKEKEAGVLTARMKTQLEALKKDSGTKAKKRILFVVGYDPLIVAGGDNFFDESTEYLGALNVVGKSRLKYPTYSNELLIRAAPEVVLDLTMGTEKQNADPEARLAWWSQFASIPAVKNKQIYFFDIEKMRAVPTLPAALREIFNLIHPSQQL